MINEKRLQDARQYWDDIVPSFDDEPDHGLRDPLILASWIKLLRTWLPDRHGNILDIGCGTGALSVVLLGLNTKLQGLICHQE